MQPRNIIVIHGTKGSPHINWFPWLSQECTKLGHKVYVPEFPTPENQHPLHWMSALHQQAPLIDENTIIIGHSIGATFLLHILESLQQPLYKSIFVAPVLKDIGITEYDELNAPFIKYDSFNWDKISENAGDRYLLHGDNDPYVPQTHSEFLQDQIGGELIIVPNGGHLNGESGYTQFELLIDLITQPPQSFD